MSGDRPHRTPRAHALARLGIAAAAAVAAWWTRATVSQWSDRTSVFVAATVLVFLLVLLVDWLIAAVAPGLWRFVRSLARSLWAGAMADPEVRAFAERHPRSAAWLERRTATDSWKGLHLTLTLAAVAYFLSSFVSVARHVAYEALFSAYDLRIAALLHAFRNPALTRFLWVFTVLGDTRVAFALTTIVVLLLLLWGHRLEAAFVGVAVAGGSLVGALAKLVVQRPRPEIAFALIKEPASFSLPSGHALYTMLFWGALAFLALRTAPSVFRKLAASLACATLIAMTALSRVYLGVHWPSDVLASWALALAWLAGCIGAYLMLARYGGAWGTAPAGSTAIRVATAVAATAVAAAVVVGGAASDPLLREAAAAPAVTVWATSVDTNGLPAPSAVQARPLPRVSEKLDGSPQEPVGLIYVGSRDQLVRELGRAGWSVADPPTPMTLLHTLAAAYADRAYPAAPVTPAFLAGQVQDIAFEKPDGRATVRRRHHSRWWKTRFTFGGESVWVATASLDASLEIGSAIPILTHHIAPDIDAEQRYLITDLVRVGATAAARVRVSPPSSGTNAAGDAWFTDGIATVLVAGP